MVCPSCEARFAAREPLPRQQDHGRLGRLRNMKAYIGACPACGNVVMSGEDKYCNSCGQRLEWPAWEDDPWDGWEA